MHFIKYASEDYKTAWDFCYNIYRQRLHRMALCSLSFASIRDDEAVGELNLTLHQNAMRFSSQTWFLNWMTCRQTAECLNDRRRTRVAAGRRTWLQQPYSCVSTVSSFYVLG